MGAYMAGLTVLSPRAPLQARNPGRCMAVGDGVEHAARSCVSEGPGDHAWGPGRIGRKGPYRGTARGAA